MADYETLRRRHAEQYRALAQQYIERIQRTPERLRAERQQQLRMLLHKAKDSSPWHRGRLSRIDPDQATEADLQAIPPMTKEDLMRDFDAILTDRRLSRQNGRGPYRPLGRRCVLARRIPRWRLMRLKR